jgi:hypothetical protein
MKKEERSGEKNPGWCFIAADNFFDIAGKPDIIKGDGTGTICDGRISVQELDGSIGVQPSVECS